MCTEAENNMKKGNMDKAYRTDKPVLEERKSRSRAIVDQNDHT